MIYIDNNYAKLYEVIDIVFNGHIHSLYGYEIVVDWNTHSFIRRYPANWGIADEMPHAAGNFGAHYCHRICLISFYCYCNGDRLVGVDVEPKVLPVVPMLRRPAKFAPPCKILSPKKKMSSATSKAALRHAS